GGARHRSGKCVAPRRAAAAAFPGLRAGSRMRRALCALLLALAAAPATACTCGTWAPFLDASKNVPVIVHARVLEYDRKSGDFPLAMLIEVIQPARNAAVGEKIRVWGDNGMLCRPYVSAFPPGTEWVFALGGDHRLAPEQQAANLREFSIGGCG